WGKLFDFPHKAINLHWLPTAHDLKGMAAHAPLLAFGKGRSYGDSCLIENGSLLHTRGLDHFLHFDPITGILRCESGVTLADILELVVPHGWFLPVVPGTKFVTIGGAIAN